MPNFALGYAVLNTLPPMSPLEQTLVVAVAAIIIGKGMELFLVHVVMQRIVSHTSTDLDDRILEHVHGPLYITIVLTGIYIATLPLSIPSQYDFLIGASFLSLITLFWARAILHIGRMLIKFSQRSKRIDHDFGPVFENLWTFVVIIGVLFTVLSIWKVNITPLLASAGIAGVAIGFAAKDTVANFFGGIALYFDNTYKIGDYIVLDSGDEGTVTDVGIRSTTIKTREDVLVTVPNSVLNNSKVTNQSVPKPKKRITIPIGVAYGTDVDALEEILLEVAGNNEHVVDDPEPHTYFKGFGDSALNYELRVWVPEPTRDIRAKHELNRRIYKRLDEAGIEIPFPQRDVHVDTDLVG